jgi:hypothetical protein
MSFGRFSPSFSTEGLSEATADVCPPNSRCLRAGLRALTTDPTRLRHEKTSRRSRGPARFLLMTSATFAIWMLSCSLSFSGADEVLQATCDRIKHEIGNCSCAIEFLRQNIGAENAEILMQDWAISVDQKDVSRKTFSAFYREHSQQEMLRAAASFLKVRVEFYTRCQPPESYLWDLN